MAAKDTASSLSATIHLRPTKGCPKGSSSLALPLLQEASFEESAKENFGRATYKSKKDSTLLYIFRQIREMDDLGGIHSSAQQCETLNGIEKLKWLARKFEESKCTTQDDKIDSVQPETPAPNTAHHGCRGNRSSRRRQHGRFKRDTKQRYLPHGEALPPLFFPSLTQQNNNIGPVMAAAEVLQRPNATSRSDWRSACAVGSKSSTFAPSVSPMPSAEPQIAATCLILPVLQELHRLKTIINAHNIEKERNAMHSHPEEPGGVQTSDDMSMSSTEDGHTSCEVRGGNFGDVSYGLTESEDVVTAIKCSGVQYTGVEEIFCHKVDVEDPSGQGESNNQKKDHFLSSKDLPGDSNVAVCETGIGSVELRESSSPKSDPPPLPISRICHGEDHESPSSPPEQIHVGINPLYQHGFQPFKLLEVS